MTKYGVERGDFAVTSFFFTTLKEKLHESQMDTSPLAIMSSFVHEYFDDDYKEPHYSFAAVTLMLIISEKLNHSLI